MKKSTINIEVSLDENNIPEHITWKADEHPSSEWMESKAIALSIWDSEQQDALSLDLWTKDMDVQDMKRFYTNTLGAASAAILHATGDESMAEEIKKLCEKLVEHLTCPSKQY